MENLPDATEILIVGAGPTGLALAAELRRQGLEPVIIDRQAEGANTSRAAVVHARTLEVLEPLGVTSRLLDIGVKVPVFRVRDGGSVLAEIDFAGLDSPYPFTLMCPQNRMEALLLGRLEELGGTVLRPLTVEAVTVGDDFSDVVISDGTNRRTIRAKWLIGCDGGHSVVRQAAGIAFEGDRYDEDFVLADVKMDWPIPRDEVSLFLSPKGLIVIAPLPEDRFRIVATIDRAPETVDAATFEDILRERTPFWKDRNLTETVWTSRFHLQHRVAATPLSRQVVLCGDAAHVHSPAGGQGMNTGIQDAVSLATPLKQVTATDGRSELEAWSTSRHAIAEDVVAFTDRMTRMATLRSPLARSLRNAAFGAVGHLPWATAKIARKISEIDNR